MALAFFSLPVAGQDLLARQAPLDKKMRAVDSVALQRLVGEEQLENPAFGLYPDWNNQYAHHYDVELPEEYKIDLRHFCMPTPSTRITSNYGYRASFGRQHKGLDIKVYIGDTIRAAFSGKVRIVNYERRGYGKYIVIRHPNGLETIYGHLSKHLVKENQIVHAGEPIGLGGNTGRSTGSHLHFETRFLGQAINPAEMFDFVAQDVTGDYYIFRSHKSKASSADKSSTTRPKPVARPPALWACFLCREVSPMRRRRLWLRMWLWMMIACTASVSRRHRAFSAACGATTNGSPCPGMAKSWKTPCRV